jgi:hypothetical protein
MLVPSYRDEVIILITYRPFHRKATKLTRPRRVCNDSAVVRALQALRRRSEEGASGQALERACTLRRECRYGRKTVMDACRSRISRGKPDAGTGQPSITDVKNLAYESRYKYWREGRRIEGLATWHHNFRRYPIRRACKVTIAERGPTRAQ